MEKRTHSRGSSRLSSSVSAGGPRPSHLRTVGNSTPLKWSSSASSNLHGRTGRRGHSGRSFHLSMSNVSEISHHRCFCLSLCLYVCQSLCLSVSLSICLSIPLSLCLSVSLSICLSIPLSLCLRLCVFVILPLSCVPCGGRPSSCPSLFLSSLGHPLPPPPPPRTAASALELGPGDGSMEWCLYYHETCGMDFFTWLLDSLPDEVPCLAVERPRARILHSSLLRLLYCGTPTYS